MPAQALRQIRDDDVTCPAGSRVGDVGCWCGVEKGVIEGHLDPTSLERFCCGDYTTCPTWRAERERVWDQRRAALVETGLPE